MDEWEGSDDGLDTDEEKVIETFCHSTELQCFIEGEEGRFRR